MKSFLRHRLLLALVAALTLLWAPFLSAQPAAAADTSAVDESRRLPGDELRQEDVDGFRLSQGGFPIFGSQLFQGDFRDLSFTGFNPDYQINIGDEIQVMLWGALEHVLDLTVDAQGNIFIPRVGPITVLGVRNADLNNLINDHIGSVYRENVDAYANLRSTQTVKVFVSGAVRKPGLFEGYASDSVLYYLDRADGIDPERGSYLQVSVLRREMVVAEVNLYDFLRHGTLPVTQFRDGDVILVGTRNNTAIVSGAVINPARFEFSEPTVPLGRLLELASPTGTATTVSIRRARAGAAQAKVMQLSEAGAVTVEPNDHVEVMARNVPDSIFVTIAGEHAGPTRIVLPYGSLLSDGIAQIIPTSRSDLASLQLFRESVAQRQRTLLHQSLENLERSVLNARSASLEEARLRLTESEMILSFIARARKVEPKGQVLLKGPDDADRIHLEDGDILFVPTKTILVTVHGEVNFPNTQTFRERDNIMQYIERAGGFTPNANRKEILVIRTNGAIETLGRSWRATINPGDEIFILPEPDSKTLQFAKDITQIVYQIAISTRVAVGL